MKKIGFLSFGHWAPSPQSQARSAADALLQSIDLAVAAEELGADGAYFCVHHFAHPEADTLLMTVPNQLGVAYNAHVIEAILTHVAPPPDISVSSRRARHRTRISQET
jgi:alkanesulfonate monooxygenase SsuD/methylene tetrahydromethanopterin reductase-like flavin-dependent oxidoreductase (luciferase family)